MQRVLSRGVYEEQYERSLRDCMAGSEGFEEMLAAHKSQVREAVDFYVSCMMHHARTSVAFRDQARASFMRLAGAVVTCALLSK